MTASAVRLLSVCLLLLFGFPTFAGAQQDVRKPRKFALLIAVTDLKYTPSRSLKGPANDVSRLRDLLVDRFGFAPADILTVEKQAATKAGLIRAVETQLVAKSQPGDLCLLYYSGHGTQVADQAPLDEAEGLDEALVPYDANITHGLRLDTRKPCDGIGCEGDKCEGGDPVPGTLLLDDQLNVLLARIKTNNVVVLLDACHSGTATRGGAVDKRWVRAKAKDKPDTTGAVAASDDLGGDLLEPTVLTAAASNQTAKDWPFLAEQRAAAGQTDASQSNTNDNMGAFTYFLLEALQAKENATYRQVMSHIAARLNAREFTQTPQLEGRGLDRLFLSVAAAAPTPASGDGAFGPFRVPGPTQARVIAREGKMLRLRAMSGRSLSVGSIFSDGSTAVQVGAAAAFDGRESGAALLGGSA
ncbi:MAG: caspase family protein, partial [Armatimonadota bacterium]